MTRSGLLLVSALILVSGCATGGAHQNFRNVIQSDVGMSVDYPYISWNWYRRNRGDIRKLGNGNDEYQYFWDRREQSKCVVFFEVDNASQRINAVRFEGTADTCYLIP